MDKKFFDQKIWSVLAACLAVLMLLLLAAGVGNIHFRAGQPLTKGETINFQVTADKVSEEMASIPVWKQVVFWILVFLLILLAVSLFPPEWRKRILKYLLRYALFVLVLFILVRNFHGLFSAMNLPKTGAIENPPPAGVESAPPVFTPPQVSATLLYFTSLGIILILAGIAFWVGRAWIHNQRRKKDSHPLQGLVEVARSSLSDLSSGRKWEDVIFECYARMSEAVSDRRGLRRRKDLTAGEFAARLETAGLPGEAVGRLTRLFEAARYGTRQASRVEVAEAIACMRTILYACGVKE